MTKAIQKVVEGVVSVESIMMEDQIIMVFLNVEGLDGHGEDGQVR